MATDDELYRCSKCIRQHEETSGIGKRHLRYRQEMVPTLTVRNLKATHAEPVCSLCSGSGFIELDRIGLSRRYCECGKETRDERIGIILRRGHLRIPHSGPAAVPEDERAEALARAYLARVSTGA